MLGTSSKQKKAGRKTVDTVGFHQYDAATLESIELVIQSKLTIGDH